MTVMYTNMEAALAWIRSDRFWFPPGHAPGKDLYDDPDIYFPKSKDLYMMLVFALGLYILRHLFVKVVARPLAIKLNITEQRKIPKENHILQEVYESTKKPSSDHMKQLSETLQWKERNVVNWFRRRRNADRPNLFKKFAEASWRCFFYTCVFTFGICILMQAPWFWDTFQCWVDYPRQNVWTTIYLYYMFEGGFYISLLFSIMSDVKRKDFTEQLIHHVATLSLIMFSFIVNFVRVGSLVMAVHDVSDIFLEFGKCLVYAKKKDSANSVFTIFSIVFIISRLIIYPYACIHTVLIKKLSFFTIYPGYYFFNAFLMILQFLHIFWARIIVKMAIKLLKQGEVEKDERSDVDEVTSDEDEANDEVLAT